MQSFRHDSALRITQQAPEGAVFPGSRHSSDRLNSTHGGCLVHSNDFQNVADAQGSDQDLYFQLGDLLERDISRKKKMSCAKLEAARGLKGIRCS